MRGRFGRLRAGCRGGRLATSIIAADPGLGRSTDRVASRPGRARRSPQRSTGAAPAAIAASTVIGRSATGTATAPTAARASIPSGSTPPPTAMHGTPAACGAPGDAERGLAERGLGVDPALAGDDEVGAGEAGVEVGRLHDRSTPGPQRERAERGPGSRAARTRRRPPRRRPGVSRSRPAGRRFEGVGEGGERRVEVRDVGRRSRPSAARRRRPRRTARGAGSRRRRRPRGRRRRAAGRGRRGRRRRRRGRRSAPRPRSRPAPPSVVALPPMPRTIDVDARRRARPGSARRSRPTWRAIGVALAGCDARQARTPRPSRRRRACRRRDRSQRAAIGRPSGSATVASCHVQPPAAATASSVPSPPSASGQRRIVSSGRARDQPSASARATSTEVSEPLNESGAMRIVRARASAPSRRLTPGGVARPPGPRARPAAGALGQRRPAGAARGTPGSGSSAGAPGRPAR